MNYSLSNNPIRSEDIGWFGEESHITKLAIDRGFTTPEAMIELEAEWENFTVKLLQQWTPNALKDYLKDRKQKKIKDMRDHYQHITQKINELETENKEARVKGISFKDRQAITDKLKKTIEYRDTLKDKADDIKRIELPSYNVLQLIERNEMGTISDHGLEKLLDIKYPTDYLVALTKPQ